MSKQSLRLPRHQPQTPGIGHHGSLHPNPGHGPSSLRRLITSQSDVFLASSLPASRSNPNSALPSAKSHQTYRSSLSRQKSHTAASSSAARTSGSSWDTDKAPTRSNTMSTLASSQLPSSKSMSIDSKVSREPNHVRAASFASSSPGNAFPRRHLGRAGITIPLNNSVSQLATLSHSNHEHIAVRSFPHLAKPAGTASGSSGTAPNHAGPMNPDTGGGRIKARRKRIYRLNSKAPEGEPLSPDLDDASEALSDSPVARHRM